MQEEVMMQDSLSDKNDDVQKIKSQFKEMEEEAKELAIRQKQLERELSSQKTTGDDADARSIYIGNVDYSTTPEDLQKHFSSCGVIHRVTILCDKFTGHPKGFAYVEFASQESVQNALALNQSLLNNRQLNVMAKRTNIPQYHFRGKFPSRGRGGRSRFHPFRPRGRGGSRGRGGA